MTTDTIIVPTPKSTTGRSLARTVREILMLLAILGLIASNVATVVSSAFADAVHGAVSAVAGIASAKLAERVLSSSSKVRQVKAVEAATKEMTVKASAQEARFKDLEGQHKTLQTRHIDLDKQHKVLRAQDIDLGKRHKALEAEHTKLVGVHEVLDKEAKAAVASKAAHVKLTKSATSNIRARLVRGTARHVAALPSEAVPAVGTAVVIGMAAYDVYDACKTMKELNGVLKAAEQPLEDETGICGVKMPTYAEVVGLVIKNWRNAVNESKSVLGDLDGKVSIPDVHIPTAGEVLRVTCPALPIPRLCTK